MKNLRYSITDDRGTPTRIATTQELFDEGLKTEDMNLPSIGYKSSGKGLLGDTLHWSFLLYMILYVVLIGGITFSMTRLGANGSLSFAVGMIIGNLIAFLIYSAVWHRSLAFRFREAILGVQRCPACVYQLTDIIEDDDGCTVCPECGAAWKLPPAHESEPASGETGSG